MDDFRLEQAFDWVTRNLWNWFVTLKYPKEKSPKHRDSRASSAEVAFEWWTTEMLMWDGKPELDSYLCAIERRNNGDTLFHVLLCKGFNDPELSNWRWRWFEISGGSSWERPLDSKIVGLFRYFFFRVHCDIKYNIAGESALFLATDYQRE
jgi:hypothetical protein